MKFLLDESADARFANYLENLGHDVWSIAGNYQPGLPDQEVLAIAAQNQRVLITNDLDFGDLHGLPHAGVILFRLESVELQMKLSRLAFVLSRYAQHLEEHRFLVVF